MFLRKLKIANQLVHKNKQQIELKKIKKNNFLKKNDEISQYKPKGEDKKIEIFILFLLI